MDMGKQNQYNKAYSVLGGDGEFKDCKPLLCMFWSLFDKKNFKRFAAIKTKSGCGYDSEYKLNLLKAMTGISISSPNYVARQKQRKAFNNGRDNQEKLTDPRVIKMFSMKNKVCFVCEGEPHHRHHVLQIQFGGSNSFRNIVHVCRSCHKEIHRS